MPLYIQGAVGIAAVIGHNWPVFLNFSAGRGVLTLVGAIVALEPKLGTFLVLLSFLGIPFHALATTATISIFLATVMAWFSTTPVISWFFNAPLGDDKLTMTLIFFCLWLVIVIRRLTVPFSSFAHEISRGELMLNRFFLDRDIRSRELWLSRNSNNIMGKGEERQSK
jgi:acyl phosphate:glycerol-3-phosphate acyltransferase